MSDIPLSKVIAGWFEYNVNDIVQPETAAAVTAWTQHNYSVSAIADADGWIDVRGHTRLVILATPGTEDGDYDVEFRNGANDPRVQSIAGATQAGVVAGTTVELYKGECEYMSHIRVLHNKAGGTAGTSVISVLIK